MGTCVLCGQNRKLTDEHIWSDSVLRVFDASGPLTIDERRGIVYRGDPTIKDVCSECNGGMSECDSYLAGLAQRYLVRDLSGEPISLDRATLLRWVIKTSANHSRWNGDVRGWWRKYVSFIRHGTNVPDMDLFAAPWYDTRPFFLQQMMPVNALDAKTLSLHALINPTWKEISAYFEAGWALKVGTAVFTFVDWKEGTPCRLRRQTCKSMRGYGWSLVAEDVFPKRSPFNDITCLLYNMVSDPANIDQLERLIST